MKRILTCFLLTLLLLLLCSCGSKSNSAAVKFYYLEASPEYHTSKVIIQAESRELPTQYTDLESLLSTYLKGPDTATLVSPFPKGTHLINVQPGKEYIEVVISDEIGKLTGVDLTLACACISATLLEVSQLESVQIKAESVPIGPQGYVVMNQQSIPFLN